MQRVTDHNNKFVICSEAFELTRTKINQQLFGGLITGWEMSSPPPSRSLDENPPPPLDHHVPRIRTESYVPT